MSPYWKFAIVYTLVAQGIAGVGGLLGWLLTGDLGGWAGMSIGAFIVSIGWSLYLWITEEVL